VGVHPVHETFAGIPEDPQVVNHDHLEGNPPSFNGDIANTFEEPVSG
jgi:hypothetical protein